jgi:putative ABC transport system permease protein
MRPLERKLLRDLWHYRGPMAAIVAVTTCGIALFISLRSMNGYLRLSRDRYYAAYRLADVFASVKRAPSSVAARIGSIPSVRAVDSRIVYDVVLDVAGLTEPATGRLVSLPVPRRPMLNALHLSTGRWPRPEQPSEVVASVAFSNANMLAVGDSMGAVINGRWEWLRIVGTGMSPEYVYEIGGTNIFPDNRRFGVIWMSQRALADAFDMQGAFNDLVIGLAPGAPTRAVIAEVDRLLAPYGSAGAFERRDLMSVQFLDGEIDETTVTSVLLPGIFLAVTAFLLHIVLSRLVSMQREQIAVLKAFGYSNVAVGTHFLGMAIAPVAIGSVVGSGLGVWLAARFAVIYGRFFQFPPAPFVADWQVVLGAVVIALAAAAIGGVGAVSQCVSLPPAEAMRPESPVQYSRTGFSLAGWSMAPSVRIIARNLERRPGRTLLSIVALALAVSLVTTSGAMFDAISYMKELQFHLAAREDVTVVFDAPRARGAVSALGELPGVLAAEAFRALPVRLRSPKRSYRTAIIGLPSDGRLHRIIDEDRREYRPPRAGLLMSSVLAHLLDVRAGDRVVVEVLEGTRARRVVEVAGIVDELFGATAYMELAAVGTLVESGPTVSGAFLATDPRLADSLYVRLKHLPAVSGVRVRSAELASFERTIAQSFTISLSVTMVFALVIAFGIVYNGARVALSERGRELASLRVLGFSKGEVTTMLLGEQAILTLASVPAGLAIAYGLCWLLSVRFESNLYRIPIVTSARTYLFGACVVVISAMLSGLAVRGRVRRLDLVAVLKTRE